MRIRIALALVAAALLVGCASTEPPMGQAMMVRAVNFAGEQGVDAGLSSTAMPESPSPETKMASSYGASKPVRIYWFLGAR